MTLVSDERLMAYVDGELPDDEARALEIMLAEDPELRARLAPFEATGHPLAKVYEPVLAAPVPAELLATIARASISHALRGDKGSAARGLSLSHLFREFFAPAGLTAMSTASAVLLFAVGAAGGWVAAHHTAPAASLVASGADNTLVATAALADALDGAPSANPDTAPAIVPVSTFAAKDGGFCRAYRIRKPFAGAEVNGVACRSAGASAWRIAAHVESATKPSAPGPEYETAGGDSQPVEAMVGELIKGDILTPEDEAALIARRWNAE